MRPAKRPAAVSPAVYAAAAFVALSFSAILRFLYRAIPQTVARVTFFPQLLLFRARLRSFAGITRDALVADGIMGSVTRRLSVPGSDWCN